MNILFLFFICFFCYFMIIKLFNSSGIKFTGVGAHPLALFFYCNIFIFSFPGVVLISFLDYSSWRYDFLSKSFKLEIGLWYLYSVICLVMIVFFSAKALKIKNIKRRYKCYIDKRQFETFSNSLILLSVLYIVFLYCKTPNNPFFLAISGNVIESYSMRVEIQNNYSQYQIAYLTDIMTWIVKYQFIYILYVKYTSAVPVTFKRLVLSFAPVVFVLLFDMQKAPIIIYGLVCCFFIYSCTGRWKIIFYSVIITLLLLIVVYSLTTDYDINIIFGSMIDRLFLGQNQGFYSIINYIIPDQKYWAQGLPFSSIFGFSQERADVDVLPYLYGINQVNNMVNTNSYYLGQAWSMFGYIGLIISPIFVGVSISIYLKILDILLSINTSVFLPLSFLIIISFQINQSFTYFIYPKHMYFPLIFIAPLLIIIFNLCKR